MTNDDILDLINATYDIDPNHTPTISFDYAINPLHRITAIIGGSGTGKTTLMRKLMGVENTEFCIDSPDSITKILFDLNPNVEEVFKLLFDVGLSSVPIWKCNFKTLSNGEKLRFEIAYKILSAHDYVYVDEFTSVLDRQTAMNLCYNLEAILEKYNKKFVFASCHYDILDWMNTGELFDTNLKKSLPLSDLKSAQNTTWRSILRNEVVGEYLGTITI